MSFSEMMTGFSTSPGLLYWNDIMKFKARVICTFVRNITNNHSRKVAAQLLFKSLKIKGFWVLVRDPPNYGKRASI